MDPSVETVSPACRTSMSAVAGALFRRKTIDLSAVTDTKLSRCLSTLDLTALGIGSTLGAGIYVVAGQVAREIAGPSVVLSFFVAAVASVFAGLCYAEFGARVPKTGSAYVYSYVTVGELWAFVIGWNLILEYIIGTASVARAWTSYFDSLINGTIQNFWETHLPIHVPGLSPYPDFFALGITLVLTAVLAIGVKESSIVNNIFTALNLVVVAYVVICGLFKADLHNWKIPEDEIPGLNHTEYGHGGFFPWGVSGTLSGAATCFYAFVGFDCIATTGEEVKNPQRAIPISIILCLAACSVAYCSISAVLTLMTPYYLLDPNAPLPMVFAAVGWDVAKYVIAVGAICGLSTSLLGAMFPMPRIIYAMSSDGLLFNFLSIINERFKTPLIATVISGLLAGSMAMMFELSALVEMMSIGTLLAYTLVAACVLILRYDLPIGVTLDIQESAAEAPYPGFLRAVFNTTKLQEPTRMSAFIVKVGVFILGSLIIVISLLIVELPSELASASWWAISLITGMALLIIFNMVIIGLQPQSQQRLSFKVPLVPVLPMLSMFINIYLMLKLSFLTWMRFLVWMAVGFIIYFAYGVWYSKERPVNQQNYESLEPEDGAARGAAAVTPPSPPVPMRETTALVNR